MIGQLPVLSFAEELHLLNAQELRPLLLQLTSQLTQLPFGFLTQLVSLLGTGEAHALDLRLN